MVQLAPVVVQIRSGKNAGKPLGTLGRVAIERSAAAALARAGIPPAIPADAIVLSAPLRVRQQDPDLAGDQTLQVRPTTQKWTVGKATWNNKPTVGAPIVPVTRTAPKGGSWWTFDIASIVQSWVDGSKPNYGLQLERPEATPARMFVYGSESKSPPTLEVEWVSPGAAPWDLSPNGAAVSVSHPVLTFAVPPGTTGVRVQLARDEDFPSGLFDSGVRTSSVGVVELADTAFAGIALGETWYWRPLAVNPLGPSDWAPAATLSRTAKPAVVIISPLEVTDDNTPPIQWTVADGVQVASQVLVRKPNGTLVDDSGFVDGTATSWTPSKPIAQENRDAVIEVQVTDDVDRATTPGDPPYAVATRTTTLQSAAGVAGPDTATAVAENGRPVTHLAATRAAAPDGWGVIRNGERIYQSDDPTTTFEWDDWTAPMYHVHRYRIAPIVNGAWSANGEELVVAPRCLGAWLADPATGDAAPLWGENDPEWDETEIAVTHQPTGGPAVRRTTYRPPPTGGFTGQVVDTDVAGAPTADEAIAILTRFKDEDPLLRFIIGHVNLAIYADDLQLKPLVTTGEGFRHAECSFKFRGQPDPWKVD